MPKKSEHGEAITSNNKYDLLFGVTTSEALWRFAEKDLQKGFEGERRDRIIRTYVRNAYMYHLTEIFYTVSKNYTLFSFFFFSTCSTSYSVKTYILCSVKYKCH